MIFFAELKFILAKYAKISVFAFINGSVVIYTLKSWWPQQTADERLLIGFVPVLVLCVIEYKLLGLTFLLEKSPIERRILEIANE